MVLIKSRIGFLALSVVILFAGCSKKVIVTDGDCGPIQHAEIYYTIKGVLTVVPYGPIYTNQKGIAKVPSDTDSLTVKKEKYKPCHISSEKNNSFDWPLRVFLYEETEEYESGLTDWNLCMEDE